MLCFVPRRLPLAVSRVENERMRRIGGQNWYAYRSLSVDVRTGGQWKLFGACHAMLQARPSSSSDRIMRVHVQNPRCLAPCDTFSVKNRSLYKFEYHFSSHFAWEFMIIKKKVREVRQNLLNVPFLEQHSATLVEWISL